MIYQLNNMKNLSDKDLISMISMTHDYQSYPKQDERFIGKIIHLPYTDVTNHYLKRRLYINKTKHPEITCTSCEDEPVWWKILRYDEDSESAKYTFAGLAILVDNRNRVIVCDTKDISTLIYPPEYYFERNEVVLPKAFTWEEFNESYIKEKIQFIPIQDQDHLGRHICTEYYRDIITLPEMENIMNQVMEEKNNKEEAIKAAKLRYTPYNFMTPEWLKSFPVYYNRHLQNYVDDPRRAVNRGVIIRCDESGSTINPYIVIKEECKDGKVRYVTNREANIYYDNKDEKKDNIKDLSLF